MIFRLNHCYRPCFLRNELGMLLCTRRFMFATGSYRAYGRSKA